MSSILSHEEEDEDLKNKVSPRANQSSMSSLMSYDPAANDETEIMKKRRSSKADPNNQDNMANTLNQIQVTIYTTFPCIIIK